MNALKATNKSIKTLAKAIAVSVALMSTPSMADMPVIDLTNIAQSIITASNTTNQLIAKYEEMRLNYMKLQGLAGNFQDIVGELRKLGEMEGALSSLQGSLGQAKSLMDDRYARFAASNTASWDEFMGLERERYQKGYQITRANYQRDREVLDNIKSQYAKVKTMQSQNTVLQGPLESQQLLNSQINMLLTQNTQMLEMVTSKSALDAQEQQDVRAAQKANQQAIDDIKNNYQKYHDQNNYQVGN